MGPEKKPQFQATPSKITFAIESVRDNLKRGKRAMNQVNHMVEAFDSEAAKISLDARFSQVSMGGASWKQYLQKAVKMYQEMITLFKHSGAVPKYEDDHENDFIIEEEDVDAFGTFVVKNKEDFKKHWKALGISFEAVSKEPTWKKGEKDYDEDSESKTLKRAILGVHSIVVDNSSPPLKDPDGDGFLEGEELPSAKKQRLQGTFLQTFSRFLQMFLHPLCMFFADEKDQKQKDLAAAEDGLAKGPGKKRKRKAPKDDDGNVPDAEAEAKEAKRLKELRKSKKTGSGSNSTDQALTDLLKSESVAANALKRTEDSKKAYAAAINPKAYLTDPAFNEAKAFMDDCYIQDADSLGVSDNETLNQLSAYMKPNAKKLVDVLHILANVEA